MDPMDPDMTGKRKGSGPGGPGGKKQKPSNNDDDHQNAGVVTAQLSQPSHQQSAFPLVVQQPGGMVMHAVPYVSASYAQPSEQELEMHRSLHAQQLVDMQQPGPKLMPAPPPARGSKVRRRTSAWNAFLSHKYKERTTNEPYTQFVLDRQKEWQEMTDDQKAQYVNMASEITATRTAQPQQDVPKQRIRREPVFKDIQRVKKKLEEIAERYENFDYACFFHCADRKFYETHASESLQPFVNNTLIQKLVFSAARAPAVWSDNASARRAAAEAAQQQAQDQGQESQATSPQHQQGGGAFSLLFQQ